MQCQGYLALHVIFMEQPFDHNGDGTTDLAFVNENTGRHSIYHIHDGHLQDYLVY
jgi:hypothetical protein